MLSPFFHIHKSQLPSSSTTLEREREREREGERERVEMVISIHSCEHADDDDYIDMEVSSYTNLFSNSIINSPQHPREFEFQMSSKPLEREPTTSPADELFYKGKLLPLHLPPRLQMVEKLLQNTTNSAFDYKMDTFEEFFCTPLATTTTTPTTTSTPFESCNISPSDSCQVSRELNPEEYFFQYSAQVSGFIGDNPKKSWTKKLKLIKQSSLGSKLKASRAYLKSFFSKSGCSEDQSSATAARNIEERSVSQARESSSKYMKVAKKIPFGQIQNTSQMTKSNDKENITGDSGSSHRRSFSGVIKRHLTIKSSCSSSSSDSSTSSCSSNSTRFNEVKYLKRSSSSKSEFENSIQGAIAHCKQSQQLLRSRKTLSEVGFCSYPAVC